MDGKRDFDSIAERYAVQAEGRRIVKLIMLGLGAILVYLGYTGKYKDVAGILGVKR